MHTYSYIIHSPHADQPWIVLEFLPYGDLKHFLTVSLIVCIIALDQLNNNHAEKETASEQTGQIHAGCRYWDALHL